MTIVERSHTNDNYNITLELDKLYGSNFSYVVRAYRIIEGIIGYPEREMIYSVNEKEKAIRAYNRYVKKYV